MSDPTLNPTRFYPIARRWVAGIRRAALRQWVRAGQRAEYKTPGAVMAWCVDHFEGEKAIFHFYRMERRIHRLAFQYQGDPEVTPEHRVRPPRYLGQWLWESIREWWAA